MRSETKPSQDEEKNEQEPLLPPIQPVIDFGSVVIKNSRAAIHCLTIAGQIEGHMLLPNTQKATKYEHVLPLLAALEQRELRVESLDVSGNALFDKAFCLLNPFVAGGHVRHLSIGGMKGDQAMVEGVCASLLLNRNLEECTIVLDDTPMDCADREAL